MVNTNSFAIFQFRAKDTRQLQNRTSHDFLCYVYIIKRKGKFIRFVISLRIISLQKFAKVNEWKTYFPFNRHIQSSKSKIWASHKKLQTPLFLYCVYVVVK